MNIFIINETWDYIIPETALKLVIITEKDIIITSKLRIIKTVLSLLISYNT